MIPRHVAELPGSRWRVWRSAVLRATGFPVDGLDRLACPAAAVAADADPGGPAHRAAFAAATAHGSLVLHGIAGDPLFREAVTWQSRSALTAVDAVLAAGSAPVRHRKHRERERVLVRYWQRYCAKAETIGFFGPVAWVEVDPARRTTVVNPGADLLRDRRVYFEHWALAAFADRVARAPAVRRLLPPALQPHLCLRGREILDPTRGAHPLTTTEAALLARCDGVRSADAVAAAALADGFRSAEDVHLALDRLCERGLLRWGLDLPVGLHAEDVLRARLAEVGHADALADLQRLLAARDAVTAAAGDPDALLRALTRLDEEFTAVAGVAASRAHGQMYAGRGLCWEETTRDLAATIGHDVLSAISAPLEVVLIAARWVTLRMAEVYTTALRSLVDELCADAGTDEVPLGQVWFLAQNLFYGKGFRPADKVTAELAERWADLFGLRDLLPGTTSVHRSAADALTDARRLFPADRPGWSAARVHSPDLQLCAPDAAAFARGEFTAVLGELHIAWATNACGVFVSGHPDPDALRAALADDLGPGRLRPLLPLDWPRYSSRLAFALEDPGEAQLGFAPAPGADPARLIRMAGLVVRPAEHGLEVADDLGRTWPLVEVFDRQLAEVSVEAFKFPADGPRLTIDRMVVARRTWRTTVGECPLRRVVGAEARFLAARRWRRDLGLPERLFVKIADETKPTFVDLTSPLLVDSLATMLRSAGLSGGDAVAVVLSEMLPDTDQAWVPDAGGARYVSELRLQIVDPQTPDLTGARR